MGRQGRSVSGKPNSRIINWNAKNLGVLRQVLRVAKDEKFRNGEREGTTPTAEQIIEEFNLSTDDDWKTFTFDFLDGKRVQKGIEMDAQYASSLVQLLIKKLNVPMKKEWYLKSFAQAWERKR